MSPKYHTKHSYKDEASQEFAGGLASKPGEVERIYVQPLNKLNSDPYTFWLIDLIYYIWKRLQQVAQQARERARGSPSYVSLGFLLC